MPLNDPNFQHLQYTSMDAKSKQAILFDLNKAADHIDNILWELEKSKTYECLELWFVLNTGGDCIKGVRENVAEVH